MYLWGVCGIWWQLLGISLPAPSEALYAMSWWQIGLSCDILVPGILWNNYTQIVKIFIWLVQKSKVMLLDILHSRKWCFLKEKLVDEDSKAFIRWEKNQEQNIKLLYGEIIKSSNVCLGVLERCLNPVDWRFQVGHMHCKQQRSMLCQWVDC